MNFMQLLQSLDDVLYEVMGWLVFFPMTLWRTITRPLRMMEYADRELHDGPGDQYDDTLSPPMFLLLALLLSHALELAVGEGVNPIVASTRGLAAYVDTDSKLLLLRLALFSIIPLMLAAALLVGLGQPVGRKRLKAPFYAQCYPAGAFALIVGIGGLLLHQGRGIGGAILLGAVAVYFAVQVAWFRRHMRRSVLVAAGYAAISIFGGIAVALGLASLLV